VRHARRVLGVAAEVLNKPGRPRVMKACKEVCVVGGGRRVWDGQGQHAMKGVWLCCGKFILQKLQTARRE
jgi:hypothetical protein